MNFKLPQKINERGEISIRDAVEIILGDACGREEDTKYIMDNDKYTYYQVLQQDVIDRLPVSIDTFRDIAVPELDGNYQRGGYYSYSVSPENRIIYAAGVNACQQLTHNALALAIGYSIRNYNALAAVNMAEARLAIDDSEFRVRAEAILKLVAASEGPDEILRQAIEEPESSLIPIIDKVTSH